MNKNTLFLILGSITVLVILVVLFMTQGATAPEAEQEEETETEMEESPVINDPSEEEEEEEVTEPEEEEPTEEKPAEEGPAPQTYNVSYSDAGFSPSSVTVSAGSTVVWQNNTSECMWVASNPHPVHTDLQGFDSGGCMQTYQFTFSQEGSWGYHNHAASSQTGTIVVQ